jgi:hypothetical protein
VSRVVVSQARGCRWDELSCPVPASDTERQSDRNRRQTEKPNLSASRLERVRTRSRTAAPLISWCHRRGTKQNIAIDYGRGRYTTQPCGNPRVAEKGHRSGADAAIAGVASGQRSRLVDRRVLCRARASFAEVSAGAVAPCSSHRRGVKELRSSASPPRSDLSQRLPKDSHREIALVLRKCRVTDDKPGPGWRLSIVGVNRVRLQPARAR